MKFESVLRRGWDWTRSQDLVVLVLLFILAGGAWGFIGLAGLVRSGATNEIDSTILRAFRNPADLSDPIGPRSVEEAVRDFTALGGLPVVSLVSGAVAGFLLLTRKYQALLLLSAAFGGGMLLNYGLKTYFNRPRPEFVTPLHYVDSYSFPSGHSLLAAVIYLTLGAILAPQVARRTLRIYIMTVALSVAFMVGVSRVYLGVHYPTDVLAGWTVGLLWAIICWLASRSLQRRSKLEHRSHPPD